MSDSKYLSDVRDQYENYPYPARNPEEERKRLLPPVTECLDRLNHFGFQGKRNFHKNFRALIAGGGTGDSIIFLAEQLRDSEAEIIYIDISEASMDVAKERAKVRGLKNITWKHASILDLPKLKLGKFDYINCSGVLHHLEDPDEGLAALNSVLADDGIMGLMVYGEHARAGVYQMQNLMRLIGEDDDAQTRIDDCKTLLNKIPTTNLFYRTKDFFNDLRYGDVGVYDLFLHSQDRAYTVPQVYEYVEKQGLELVTFVGTNQYNPALYVHDQNLLKKILKKDIKTQNAIGELLCGNIKTHTFYVGNKTPATPSPEDLEMVPCFPVNNGRKTYEDFYKQLKEAKNNISFSADNIPINIKYSPELVHIFKHMDGKKSLKEIYQKATTSSKAKRPALQRAFLEFYNAMIGNQLIFLKHKDVPEYLTVQELQARN